MNKRELKGAACLCGLLMFASGIFGGFVGWSSADMHKTPEGIADCQYFDYAKFKVTSLTGTPHALIEALNEKGWQIDKNQTDGATVVAYCP